ncbi:MAG TPA: ATP-binding protein [Oscillospiraceae bacterium]|nr:ATP-binding protein [Oscillospiraceae bacterium]
MLPVILLFMAAPILSFANTVIICRSIGGNLRKNWKWLSIICLSLIILFAMIEYEKIYTKRNEYPLVPLLIYWQIILYPFLLFKKTKLNMLYVCVLYILLMSFLETMCTYAFFPDSIFSSLIMNSVIDIIFGIIIFGLLIYALKHMYADAMLKCTAVVPKFIFILILLYLIFDPMIIQSLLSPQDMISKLPSTVMQHLNMVRFIFGIFSILVLTIIFSLIFQAVTNRKYEKATQVLKNEMKNQIKYYSSISQVQHEMRAFRHDIKAQILCVRALVSANELGQAVDCLDKILGKAETSTKCFDTGNSIIDSLLTDKQQLAIQYHTNIVFTGYLPKEGFDLLDLCIITSNALDNAIEACAKDSSQNDKEILFESRWQQGYLVMNFQNSVFEKVDIIRDTVITTKPDKINHGFGLYNIKEVVKKNAGDIKIFLRENHFCLEIALHCND